MVDSNYLVKDTKSLEIFEDEILIKDEKLSEAISINRNDYSIMKKSKSSSGSGSSLCSFSFKAIYGIIELYATKYLILVTGANFVSEIISKQIFHIEKVVYIPIGQRFRVTQVNKISYPSEDRTYIQMLKDQFSRKCLYYSYDYDLTSNIQRFFTNNLEKSKYN